MTRKKGDIDTAAWTVVCNYYDNNHNKIVNTIEVEDEDKYPGCIILKSTDDPEQAVIKKDGYLKLSAEAKEVIRIILNAPKEVIAIFTPPKHKNRITKARLMKAFSFRWNSVFITERVFEEISEWIKSLR